MKQNRLLLVFFLLAMQQWLLAAPRTLRQAQAIAKQQATKLGITVDQQIISKYQTRNSTLKTAEPCYYVFNNGNDRGFTIVSGDDLLPEIVGYSATGTFDESQMPENLTAFLKAYQQMAEAVTQEDAWAVRSMAERKALQANDTYTQPTVAPLLGGIMWNQMAPYNNLCPTDKSSKKGEKCATGCVATAMAQVMAYYQYPKQLQANIPSYTTETDKYRLPGASKGEAYDWDNMLATYPENGEFTQAQTDAVAKLMYHCGMAVKMDYSSSSGACVIPAVLAKYFGYDADLMQIVFRGHYSLATWVKLIDHELEAARPILYSGVASDGGHEFVCDGADGNGLYHINWGWNGSGDGYFDITILDPSYRGTGGGSSTDGFNQGCDMIIGIAPDNGKVDEPLATRYTLSAATFEERSCTLITTQRTNSSGKFKLKIKSPIANNSADSFEGLVSVGIQKADGSYIPLADTPKTELPGIQLEGRYYDNFTSYVEYAFPVGETTIYDIYSTDGGNTWQPIAYDEGTYPYVVKATETELTLVEEKLSATLTAEEDLLSKQENLFHYTVTNQSAHEYFGYIYIYTSTTPDIPSDETDSEYINIPIAGTVERSFTLKPSTGDQYIWIKDQNGNLLVDTQKYTVTQSTAPVLTLVSKSLNATSGKYETKQGYYAGTLVKLPVVEADKAIVTYSVRNDGGDCKLQALLYTYGNNSADNSYLSYQTKHVVLKGNGAVTDIAFEFNLNDLGGNHSFSVMMALAKGYNLNTSSVEMQEIYLADDSNRGYGLTETELAGYLAGTTSGIENSVTQDTPAIRITGGTGSLSLLSPTAKTIHIYGISGQLVKSVALQPSIPSTITLSPGIYVAGGKKVLVK